MDNFADKAFYEAEYLQGKQAVITTAFDFYSRKATKIVNQKILGRIKTPTEEVKMCCCEIAELIFEFENASKDVQGNSTAGKASESVSGWSVAYRSEEEMQNALNKKINAVIYAWLSGTGLLYRGLK